VPWLKSVWWVEVIFLIQHVPTIPVVCPKLTQALDLPSITGRDHPFAHAFTAGQPYSLGTQFRVLQFINPTSHLISPTLVVTELFLYHFR
jgi:hypothetical protein